MRITVHRKTDNQLVQMHMRYTVVREQQEQHDQEVKDLPCAAPVFLPKRNTGWNDPSRIPPVLHPNAHACTYQRFTTVKAKRDITNESARPMAKVIRDVIQGLATACASGPRKVPREMAVPRIPIT